MEANKQNELNTKLSKLNYNQLCFVNTAANDINDYALPVNTFPFVYEVVKEIAKITSERLEEMDM